MAIQSEFSLSLIKQLLIGNFCDGFENNLPDCCPGGEESNTEEKRIWMAMDGHWQKRYFERVLKANCEETASDFLKNYS